VLYHRLGKFRLLYVYVRGVWLRLALSSVNGEKCYILLMLTFFLLNVRINDVYAYSSILPTNIAWVHFAENQLCKSMRA